MARISVFALSSPFQYCIRGPIYATKIRKEERKGGREGRRKGKEGSVGKERRMASSRLALGYIASSMAA
jgi:hypothetical protein